jgi:hypothetical protein
MMHISPVLGATLALAASYILYRLLSIGKRDSRLPPGPPTIPVLGNAHLIPTTGIGVKYVENRIIHPFLLCED